MAAILELTDGTTTYDLLQMAVTHTRGAALNNWRPMVPWYKDGGSWADSPIADNRIPVFARRENTVDSYELAFLGHDPDNIAVLTQELMRLINKGNEYWLSSYALAPIWLKAQASCETNPRYALVYRATVPELGNPYSQPFLMAGGSVMHEMTLVVEHGPWCDAPPLSPNCVEASSEHFSHVPPYWNTEERYADCTSEAALDDLADDAFTVDGWFWVAVGAGDAYIANKGQASNAGWLLSYSALTLAGAVRCDTTPAVSSIPFVPDSAWHHIAMTFDDAGTRKVQLWLDGVELAYSTQNAGVGAITADAADKLYLAAQDGTGVGNMAGRLGWMRVSDNLRYTVDFTAPERCVIPTSDANTIAIWTGAGWSRTLYNREGTEALNGVIYDIGTPVLPVWGFDCNESIFGHEATCEMEKYVTPGWSPYQLTHIYYYDNDAGTWSTNRLDEALPYALLPAAPANGDAVYFGIEDISIPFGNVIFDLSAGCDTSDVTWAEHGGAVGANTWNAIVAECHDGTDSGADAFANLGVNAFTWQHTTSWSVGNLQTIFGGAAPDVNAMWLRAAVGAGGWTGDAPMQQNRHVYTNNKPWIEVAAEEVTGDIPAQLKTVVLQESGNSTTWTEWTSAIVGLRSYDRDADYFQPIINLADTGNYGWVNIAVTAPASVVWAAQTYVARCVEYAPAGAGTVAAAIITIDSAYVPYFAGAFRVYLRYKETDGGTLGTAHLSFDTPYDFDSEPKQLITASEYRILDLGSVHIPSRNAFSSDLLLNLNITDTGAGPHYYFYDLVLIPLDEFAIHARWGTAYVDSEDGYSVIIDETEYPRDGLQAWVSDVNYSSHYAPANILSYQPPILQANRDQRLIVFPFANVVSDYSKIAKVNLYALRRYLGLRGAR